MEALILTSSLMRRPGFHKKDGLARRLGELHLTTTTTTLGKTYSAQMGLARRLEETHLTTTTTTLGKTYSAQMGLARRLEETHLTTTTTTLGKTYSAQMGLARRLEETHLTTTTTTLGKTYSAQMGLARRLEETHLTTTTLRKTYSAQMGLARRLEEIHLTTTTLRRRPACACRRNQSLPISEDVAPKSRRQYKKPAADSRPFREHWKLTRAAFTDHLSSTPTWRHCLDARTRDLQSPLASRCVAEPLHERRRLDQPAPSPSP
ncbi:hypothetical protein PMIN01_06745 [Paraphaeosphaeria minitans]|uniref:Uncharacterized protein n=1 Tax=Paraphaeosphaeria minitans TaxID=565426 RepID=A0A9P6KQP8_9PLEO|nr:hypothetical protein PMIN01_06745 [Paraphaeosphaeria minitans]